MVCCPHSFHTLNTLRECAAVCTVRQLYITTYTFTEQTQSIFVRTWMMNYHRGIEMHMWKNVWVHILRTLYSTGLRQSCYSLDNLTMHNTTIPSPRLTTTYADACGSELRHWIQHSFKKCSTRRSHWWRLPGWDEMLQHCPPRCATLYHSLTRPITICDRWGQIEPAEAQLTHIVCRK